MAEDAAEGGREIGAGGRRREGEDAPHFVEVWNDYDPSMRFVAIFPVGEKQGATASSVAYYIIEPGKHTGVHSDNAEEIAFVAEGEGEVFVIGAHPAARGRASSSSSRRARPRHLRPGRGSRCGCSRSSRPTEILSTFQQVDLSRSAAPCSARSRRRPVVHRARPRQPARGLPVHARRARDGGRREPGAELTMTERLLGMTEPRRGVRGAKPRSSPPSGRLERRPARSPARASPAAAPSSPEDPAGTGAGTASVGAGRMRASPRVWRNWQTRRV